MESAMNHCGLGALKLQQPTATFSLSIEHGIEQSSGTASAACVRLTTNVFALLQQHARAIAANAPPASGDSGPLDADGLVSLEP